MFDGIYFDPAVFDSGLIVIRPTLGGWTKATPTDPKWAPNDQARGTAWTAKSKGNSTW